MYTYQHACIQSCPYVHIYTTMNRCIYMYVTPSIHICMYILRTYVHIQSSTYVMQSCDMFVAHASGLLAVLCTCVHILPHSQNTMVNSYVSACTR